MRRTRRLLVWAGRVLTVIGGLALLHGLTQAIVAAPYLSQSPPETLPSALAGAEIFVGVTFAVAGGIAVRWDRGVR